MDKSKVNIIIDALMFLCVTAIAGIGFLVKFVLLTGKQTVAVYDRKVDLFFLGMNRHGWGMLHFVIACVFLSLLTLHLILHWNMILSLSRQLIGSEIARSIIAIIIVIIGVFLVVFPLVVKPEVQESEQKGRHPRESNSYEKKIIK